MIRDSLHLSKDAAADGVIPAFPWAVGSRVMWYVTRARKRG